MVCVLAKVNFAVTILLTSCHNTLSIFKSQAQVFPHFSMGCTLLESNNIFENLPSNIIRISIGLLPQKVS